MASTWGSSWGTSWASSWDRTVTATPAATVEVGHAGGRRRRRVIIDDVIYVGTDEQIEAKLWELLQARKPEPVQQKPRRIRKAKKPVELKQDYVPIPIHIEAPRFQALVADTYRHEDVFQRVLLQRMWQRYLDDEDDAEVLMLLM